MNAAPALIARLDESIEVVGWSLDGRNWIAGDLSGHSATNDGQGLAEQCSGAVTGVAFSSSARAIGTADGHLELRGERSVTVAVDNPIQDLCWSPLGDLLAVSAGSAVYVFDERGEIVSHIEPVPGTARTVRWVRGPASLAVATSRGVCWVEPGRPGEIVETWGSGAIRCLEPGPGGRLLATGDLAGTLRITDLETGEEVAIGGWSGRIDRMAWSGADSHLAVAGGDEVTLWNLPDFPAADDDPIVLHGHDCDVSSLVFAGLLGDVLVSGDEDGQIIAWRSGRLHHQEPVALGAPVRCLAAQPIGPGILVGLGDGTVHLLQDPGL